MGGRLMTVGELARRTGMSAKATRLDLPLAERLREQRLPALEADWIARRARAIGDPTRLEIVRALAEARELCACAIWPGSSSDRRISSLSTCGRCEPPISSAPGATGR
jgi:hypothetical protein